MQPPVHILADKLLGHRVKMGFQIAANGFGNQFIYIDDGVNKTTSSSLSLRERAGVRVFGCSFISSVIYIGDPALLHQGLRLLPESVRDLGLYGGGHGGYAFWKLGLQVIDDGANKTTSSSLSHRERAGVRVSGCCFISSVIYISKFVVQL
jgi:hypothetical protein